MMDHSSARWFSTGVPVSASRVRAGMRAHGLGLPGAAVLDRLRLVADDPAPRRSRAAVARSRSRRAVRRDDQIGRRPRAVSSSARVGCRRGARRPAATGANRAASFCQLLTSDIGQIEQSRRAPALPSPARPAAATASARSCRGPCRRRGCRPARAGRGSAARTDPVPGTAAGCRWNPAGVGSGVSRSAACPESRSPSVAVGVHLDQRQVLLAAVDHLLEHLARGQLALAPPVRPPAAPP